MAVAVVLAACASQPPQGDSPASPTSSTPAPSWPLPSGPTRPYRPTPTPAPTFAVYTVLRGDTLIALARRLGTSPESLAYWNRARYPSLDPDAPTYQPDRIEVGWQLAYIPGTMVDPEDLPPASEQPSGAAGTSVGPFPTLPPDGSAALVRRGAAGLAGIALTFDYTGGPGAGPGGAEAIVQWLEANRVPATVFVETGAAATDDPATTAVLRRLGGGSTVSIGLLSSTAPADGLGARLRAADAALAAVVGRSTVPLLRSAGREPGAAALAAAGPAGWTWVVAWDVDPGDGVAPGDGGPIAADIATRVVARARGGSVVRLALGGARTFQALPAIVDELAAAGLAILPLADVLGIALPDAPAPGG